MTDSAGYQVLRISSQPEKPCPHCDEPWGGHDEGCLNG